MKFLRTLGYIIFLGSGLYLYVMSLIFYYYLWEITGLVIAIFIFPAAEIFPIVTWIITKQFPSLLFIVWGIGFFGLVLVAIGGSRENRYTNVLTNTSKEKREKFRGLSITALITGILSLIPNFLFSGLENLFGSYNIYSLLVGFLQVVFIIISIVCGSIDLRHIKKDLYNKKGKSFDVAGIVLSSLNILWWFILLVLVLLSIGIL